MEFGDVLRRRKMVRTFESGQVDPSIVERILRHGQRAPSAGYSQGFEFLLLEGPDQTARFWEAATADEPVLQGVRAAPIIVIPFASKDVYLDRYAEEDKKWEDRDESRWPVPYWYIDAAFASMLILLSAVNEGLGALFFGLHPPTIPRVKETFGVPDGWDPIGAIAIGHPSGEDPVRSSAHTRRRKQFQEVVHRGHW
ncbi:MAG: nitroreductase family protein [Actinobacteria bacterium]|nr:MAG: nitroreductase family protein [Actinomycetota bacterium]